ncbi:MAG: hypothetical protein AB7V77_02180 [Candidatus Woesearchaeota archaeon]
MTKCDLCGQKIPTTFLNKLIGTVIKDKNSKKRTICADCQRKHSSEEIKNLL